MRRPWVICSSPSSGFSRPARIFSSDDLPAPLRPIRPSRSPDSSENAALSSRATWPKARWALERERTAMGIERRRCADRGDARSGERALERFDEHRGDVEPALLRDLLEAGRARHVDLGEAVADDVEADEQQSALGELRPDRFGDLAVARRQRLGDALAADGEVAADLAALRDARQRMRHRHAVDDEDALVAGGDLGEIALRHHGRRTVAIERLGDAAEVEAVGADAKDAHAAHAVERLEDDVAMLAVEALDRRLVARHDRRRDVLRE